MTPHINKSTLLQWPIDWLVRILTYLPLVELATVKSTSVVMRKLIQKSNELPRSRAVLLLKNEKYGNQIARVSMLRRLAAECPRIHSFMEPRGYLSRGVQYANSHNTDKTYTQLVFQPKPTAGTRLGRMSMQTLYDTKSAPYVKCMCVKTMSLRELLKLDVTHTKLPNLNTLALIATQEGIVESVDRTIESVCLRNLWTHLTDLDLDLSVRIWTENAAFCITNLRCLRGLTLYFLQWREQSREGVLVLSKAAYSNMRRICIQTRTDRLLWRLSESDIVTFRELLKVVEENLRKRLPDLRKTHNDDPNFVGVCLRKQK